MSDDIAAELRAATADYDWMTADGQRAMLPLDLVRHAADEIERLRAENEQLRDELHYQATIGDPR